LSRTRQSGSCLHSPRREGQRHPYHLATVVVVEAVALKGRSPTADAAKRG
uniref:Uncharacterized protein n=1 Tax=Chlorocebus sabaeus TaxID=60711 RepID=A0A0D9S962_CHLSB